MAHSTTDRPEAGGGATRRDFLDLVAWSAVAVGGITVAWPLIDSLNPSADVLALSAIEIDVTPIPKGEGISVMWRGKPVFVRSRTDREMEEARAVDVATLRDPQTDAQRVERPEWLVVVGICTHLGCVPLGNKSTEPRGDYGGWFCPCHGSQYDTSGRIRQGPAPLNLAVPPYTFSSDSIVRIG